MKEINYDRDRFIQSLRMVTFGLQILAVISTFSTFARLLDQYRLPKVFLMLPGLLIFLLSIDRCLMLNDKNFNCILRGATTGFLSGFFGNIVNDDFSDKLTTKSGLVQALCNLEFLHIPVAAGTLMCMFCFLFRRFPPLTIVILSLALGVCCSAIFSLGLVFFSAAPEVAIINKTQSFLVFVIVFLLGIIPSVNNIKQAWLLCMIGFTMSIIWQSKHLETMQWNWQLVRFPIPGFLTAILVLFFLDLIDFHECDNQKLRRRRKARKYDTNIPDTLYYDDEGSNTLATTLTWHCASYIIERTVLTLISERQHKNRPYKTDTWFCCLIMLFIYLLYVNHKKISCMEKIVLTLLAISCYLCVGVTNGILSNGYFIDNIFAIMFISLFHSADITMNI